ncbi:MAG: BatD family protein [Bacteroidales bacterium]
MFGILLANLYCLMAQEIQFTASAPTAVNAGEMFELTYTISGEPSAFKAPSFSPFIVIDGPATGYNSYTEFSNGRMRQNVTSTYTYTLQAGNTGKFKIAPATATVKNKQVSSNELVIEVVKAASAGSQTGKANANSQQQAESGTSGGGTEVFTDLLVDKKTVWQGENIVASLKLYTTLNISNMSALRLPNFNGFYKSEINTPPIRRFTEESVNGTRYGTGVVSRYLLCPQVSGELTIDPASFDLIVQRQVNKRSRSIWDMDLPMVREQQIQIATRPVKIQVKALPPGAPASFGGAVGSFKLNLQTDKTELRTNDAITVKVTISGNGNLALIKAPELKLPADFELYKPKLTLNENPSVAGNNGSVVFEYVAIARHPGDFEIPAMSFSYFSPENGTYKQLNSQPVKIHVEKGEGDSTLTVFSGVSREDVRFVGKDIRYIKNAPGKLKPAGVYLINTWAYWMAVSASVFLFGGIILFRRRIIRRNSDRVMNRNRKANRVARKRLKKARTFLTQGNRESFYEEIHRAVSGYLSDKLLIPLAELSRENIHASLLEKGIEEATVGQLNSLLDACEMARYAPVSSVPPMNEMLNDMTSLISKLDQAI